MIVEEVKANISINQQEADLLVMGLRNYVASQVGCSCEVCKEDNNELKTELNRAMSLSYNLSKIGGNMCDDTILFEHIKEWKKVKKPEGLGNNLKGAK